MAENNKKEISFEEALERLNEIVKAMKQSDEPLDDSLKLFEEGVTLVKQCNDQIDQAEAKIKQLVRSSDGTLEEQDFAVKDDASAT